MAEKIYLGKCSAKEIDTQYGPMLKLGLHVDTLIEFAKKHCNSKGYINLNISRRREPSQYGDTHSVALDTWEPRGGQQPAAPRQPAIPQQPVDNSEPPF